MFEAGFSVTENCVRVFCHYSVISMRLGGLQGPGLLTSPGQELPEGGSCAPPLRPVRSAPCRGNLCLLRQPGAQFALPTWPRPAQPVFRHPPPVSHFMMEGWGPHLPLPASGPVRSLPWGPLLGLLSSRKHHIHHLTNRCHPRPSPISSTAGAKGNPPPCSGQHSPRSSQVLPPKVAQSPFLDQATGRAEGWEACLPLAPPRGNQEESSLPH